MYTPVFFLFRDLKQPAPFHFQKHRPPQAQDLFMHDLSNSCRQTNVSLPSLSSPLLPHLDIHPTPTPTLFIWSPSRLKAKLRNPFLEASQEFVGAPPVVSKLLADIAGEEETVLGFLFSCWSPWSRAPESEARTVSFLIPRASVSIPPIGNTQYLLNDFI